MSSEGACCLPQAPAMHDLEAIRDMHKLRGPHWMQNKSAALHLATSPAAQALLMPTLFQAGAVELLLFCAPVICCKVCVRIPARSRMIAACNPCAPTWSLQTKRRQQVRPDLWAASPGGSSLDLPCPAAVSLDLLCARQYPGITSCQHPLGPHQQASPGLPPDTCMLAATLPAGLQVAWPGQLSPCCC